MDVWHISFRGRYLGGDAIVFAPDEISARELFGAEIKEHGLPDPHIWDVRRLNELEPKCFVLDDGDY